MDIQPNPIIDWYLNRAPKEWFVPPAGFDDEIRAKFSHAITAARNGDLDGWCESPEGCLALIILLDQFPRNIYRQSPESYASDAQALQVAITAVAKGFDSYAGGLQQALFYMPLMHAEDLLAQVACKALFAKLVADCPRDFEHLGFLQTAMQYAERHLVCVQELGRFPKRNEALGRSSTDDELQWLAKRPGGF